MSERIASTVDEDLKNCIAQAANNMNTSEAEVIREALHFAFSDESDFDAEVEDHVIQNLKWERMVEEHRPENRFKYLVNNIAEDFTQDFKKGLGEFGLRITRDHKFDEIDRFDIGSEEQRNALRRHTWHWYKKAVRLQEKSNRDPTDPEILEEYSGIEEAEQKEQAKAKLSEHVERAVDLLTDKKGSLRGSRARDPEEVEDMLRNRSAMPDALAEQAVGEALSKVSDLPMEVIEQVNDGEADLSEISVEEHSTETETSQPQTEPEPETEQHVDGDLDGSDHSEEEADHSEEEEQLPETAVSKAVEMMRSGSSTAEVYKTVRKYVVSDAVGEAVIEEARRRVEQPEASVETGAGDRAATDGGGDR